MNIAIVKNMTEITSLIKKSQPATATDAQLSAMTIGRLVGYALPLPSGEVAHPVEGWYIEQSLAAVKAVVGEINESYQIDIDMTMNVIRSVWRIRYNMLHSASSPETMALLDGALTNVNSKIPEGITDAMQRVSVESSSAFNYHSNEIRHALRNKF